MRHRVNDGLRVEPGNSDDQALRGGLWSPGRGAWCEMRAAVVTMKFESGWRPGGARQLRSGNTEWDQSQNSMPPRRGHSAGPGAPGVFGRPWEALTVGEDGEG